jgi:carboxyl-terminal processing protease
MEAWSLVNRAYVDSSFNHQNWWSLRQRFLRKPLDNRQATYGVIREMLASLDDPYTRLLEPSEYKNLQVSTSGALTGVGLEIGKDSGSGEVVVIAPIEGSPAAQAGLLPGDRIVAIDGQGTPELSLDQAANLMRGLQGTAVVLQVNRQEEGIRAYELIRDVINLNPVIAELHPEADALLGYIRLLQFNGNSSADLGQAILDLAEQGAQGYVLDLRNNPGGLLEAGVEIAREWLDYGTIVYTVDRQGTLGVFQASGNALSQAPLVVLVNQGTASASEILAGALQENARAELVGETTYGKGLIQSLFQLSDGSGLVVTVAKYETPLHNDINKQGITPDYFVVSAPRTVWGTAADQPYQKAVELLSLQIN